MLLEHGDLRPTDPELRDSLLLGRDPAVVSLLIAAGAAVDARDEHGYGLYSHAARFRSTATMELFSRLSEGGPPQTI